MKILEAKKRELDCQYIEERNLIWEIKAAEFSRLGQPLWNGSVYYLDSQEGDQLYIGLCEYKDLIFLEEKGVEYIMNKYGEDHIFVYLNVQILINYNDLYLFGTKQLGGRKEIISVGGTLRLEDGKKIKSLETIREYAKKEIATETKLSICIEELKYLNFVVKGNIGSFVYKYELKYKSDLQSLNIGEFDGEVYLHKKEVYDSNEYAPNIRLKSLKDFLLALWKIK